MNSFLERHEIDVARVLAVLFLADAVSNAYSVINTLLIAMLSPIWRYSGMMLAITLLSGVLAVAWFVLGTALWKHRPASRSVVKVLLWIYFAILVVVMVFGPVAEQIVQPIFEDIDFRGWSIPLRILIPLLQVPVVFVGLAALDCRSTRRRFSSR